MSKTLISSDILNEFVESSVNYKEIGKVVEIRDHFLWERDGLERHRINVWMEEYIEAWDLIVKKIGHSFFVSFDRAEKRLNNKTVGV